MPKIRKLKQSEQRFDFHEDGPYDRLVTAARTIEPRCLLVVLLRGDDLTAAGGTVGAGGVAQKLSGSG